MASSLERPPPSALSSQLRSIVDVVERRGAAYVAFFLSGASSLIFQTIWTRMLHKVFGAAPVAISTVLTVFMAGLGLGAWLGGKYAHRIKHPIITYAVAEIGVGVWGLLVPHMVTSDGWLSTVNAFLRAEFGAESGMFMVARFLCVAPLLIVPTTLMGSTLPLLTRHFVSTEHKARAAGAQVGVLYAVNTFGAASGPLLSAFILLPSVGLYVTNIIACSMNFSLAALIFLSRRWLLRDQWAPGERLKFWPGTADEDPEADADAESGDASEGSAASTGPEEPADEPGDEAAPASEEGAEPDAAASDPPAPRRKRKKKRRPRPAEGAEPAATEGAEAAAFRKPKRKKKKKRRRPKESPPELGGEADLPPAPKLGAGEREVPIPELARKTAFICFAASGAAALCYEVVWSRALAMTIGSSIYSFALILETFLIGIAVGSAIMSAFLGDRAKRFYGVSRGSLMLVFLANVPWAVDMVDPTALETDPISHPGSLVQYFMVCALYGGPIVLAELWVWLRHSRKRVESPFRDSEAWRPILTVVVAAIPVCAALFNSLRFSGHLPNIILSVVAAISVFLVLASLLSRAPVLLVAIVQLFIAGATIVSYVWQDEIPFAFAQLVVSIPEQQLQNHVGTVNGFMFLTIVLCTLPSTLGMGAMFPLTVRVWTAGGAKIAQDVASVYAGNTVGSIVGAWLPGFVLFALVGAERTLHIGVLLNMVLALIMLIAGAADPNEDQRWWTWRRLGAVALPVLGVLLMATAVGFGAVRLASFVPPSISDNALLRAGVFFPFVFTAMAVYFFLQSRSRGSAGAGRPPPRPGAWAPADVLAVALPLVLAAGLVALVRVEEHAAWANHAVGWILRVSLAAIGLFVAYAAFRERMGVELPTKEVVTPADQAGPFRSAPLKGPVPDLPTWHAVVVYILSPAIPAMLAVLWLATKDPDSDLRWSREQMTLGVFRVSLAEAMLNTATWGEPALVYYNDGLTTTVSVEQWGRHYALKNNGKVDASNGDDMPTQINVAVYPLFFHPRGPEDLDVAIVGFGSGVTVGTTLKFPVRRVDVIELERSIPEAARFFEDVNHLDYRLPHWPYVEMDRLTIINDDGRNYLASTSQQYDVIISEPSNPWITGVSDLFTEDHWRITKRRLRPGGLYCQWVQLYELSPENIKTIYRTFASQFEHVMVLSADDRSSDTVMLGSDEPIRMDLARAQATYALPGISEELERANVYSPYDIFARSLLATRSEVMRYTMIEHRRIGDRWEVDDGSLNEGVCESPTCRREAAILNTDDNARIEFAAPRDLIGFARYEGYLQRIYSQDWPYGNPIEAEIDGESVLANFGEADEASRHYAELAMSTIAHGRYGWAADLIDRSQEVGRARETAVALEVLTHLIRTDQEPSIEIEPPIPGPEMDRETARQLTEGFDRVRETVDQGAYGTAFEAMERIPSPLRLHSGPSMRFLYAYLAYKAADGRPDSYNNAVSHLEELVGTEPDYVLRNPEVYYFLARAHEALGKYGHAMRAMRAYVEARLVPINNDAEEAPEPPDGTAVTSDAPGENDKDEHPDQG